jgi:hypothetical protein
VHGVLPHLDHQQVKWTGMKRARGISEEPQFCRYVRTMYVLRDVFNGIDLVFLRANCLLRYREEGYILICTFKHRFWYLHNRRILPFFRFSKIGKIIFERLNNFLKFFSGRTLPVCIIPNIAVLSFKKTII